MAYKVKWDGTCMQSQYLGKLRQEDCSELEASLKYMNKKGYTERVTGTFSQVFSSPSPRQPTRFVSTDLCIQEVSGFIPVRLHPFALLLSTPTVWLYHIFTRPSLLAIYFG